MVRPAECGASPHRPDPWSWIPISLVDLTCATVLRPAFAGGLVGGSATARWLAPQLRGHITDRTAAALVRRGYRVHRVGQAAYIHGDGFHLIFGVWDRHAPAPAWADRLGRPSAGYRRRVARLELETRHLTFRRIRGRFAGRLAWFRQPDVRAYSFEAPPSSWLERSERRAADHNHRVRLRAGLVRDEWAVAS